MPIEPPLLIYTAYCSLDSEIARSFSVLKPLHNKMSISVKLYFLVLKGRYVETHNLFVQYHLNPRNQWKFLPFLLVYNKRLDCHCKGWRCLLQPLCQSPSVTRLIRRLCTVTIWARSCWLYREGARSGCGSGQASTQAQPSHSRGKAGKSAVQMSFCLLLVRVMILI